MEDIRGDAIFDGLLFRLPPSVPTPFPTAPKPPAPDGPQRNCRPATPAGPTTPPSSPTTQSPTALSSSRHRHLLCLPTLLHFFHLPPSPRQLPARPTARSSPHSSVRLPPAPLSASSGVPPTPLCAIARLFPNGSTSSSAVDENVLR